MALAGPRMPSASGGSSPPSDTGVYALENLGGLGAEPPGQTPWLRLNPFLPQPCRGGLLARAAAPPDHGHLGTPPRGSGSPRPGADARNCKTRSNSATPIRLGCRP